MSEIKANPSKAEIIAEITRQFPHEDTTTVMEVLDLYSTESYERNPEQIQGAILLLSKGDIGELLYLVKRAKQDWRDILYWAYYSDR